MKIKHIYHKYIKNFKAVLSVLDLRLSVMPEIQPKFSFSDKNSNWVRLEWMRSAYGGGKYLRSIGQRARQRASQADIAEIRPSFSIVGWVAFPAIDQP